MLPSGPDPGGADASGGHTSLTVRADLGGDCLSVAITDCRPETLHVFADLEPDTAATLAREAWTVGLQAVQAAYVQAERARLKELGEDLVERVRDEFTKHLADQHKRIDEELKRYFDPADGRLNERLTAFVKDDGELARQLKAHVAGDESQLAKTLAQSVGAESPLLKQLDPDNATGLVKRVEKSIEQGVESYDDALKRSMDPHVEGSPVERFLKSLKTQLREAEDDREKQLKQLTKALDANDEESLLNRLHKDVNKANEKLLEAINPEVETSPLAVMRKSLTKLLEKQAESQEAFQKDVVERLTRLETQKREAARTTHGGVAFEELVFAYVDGLLAGGPYLVSSVGNTTGVIPNNKKGDVVVEMGPDHALAGARIVVEAKRASSYTPAQALAELDEARKNREAQAGIFVMARASASAAFPRFERHGSNLLVQWDHETDDLDAYLHACLLGAMCILGTTAQGEASGDVTALHDIEARIQKEIDRLSDMEQWTSNIKRDAGKIEDAVRIAKGKLDIVVRNGREVLEALEASHPELQEGWEDPVGGDTAAPEEARAALDAKTQESASAAADAVDEVDEAP